MKKFCIFCVLVISCSVMVGATSNKTIREDSSGNEIIRCEYCDEISNEEIHTKWHSEIGIKLIKDATCECEGELNLYCKKCGKSLSNSVIPAYGHVEGKTEILEEAGCATEGKGRIVCRVCGKSMCEKIIPKTGHTFVSRYCTQCGEFDDLAESHPFVNNPLGYQLQTENTTVLEGGSYNLTVGVMGYRVRTVQRYLGEQRYKYGTFDYKTSELVQNFQKNNNLAVTGEVDLETWKAMGFTEEEWTTWDTYVHPSEITETMTRSEIIDKFIEIAYTYLGAEYIYGCAGTPEQGGDCSGFVLSCLYGIGVNPEGYDSQQHNFNEYNSRLMWNDEHFKSVKLNERDVGDLVFYCDNNGVIIHVAIYIGNDLCIESCRSTIEVMSLYKYSMKIAGVKRVLYY